MLLLTMKSSVVVHQSMGVGPLKRTVSMVAMVVVVVVASLLVQVSHQESVPHSSAAAPPPQQRPNVLFLSSDSVDGRMSKSPFFHFARLLSSSSLYCISVGFVSSLLMCVPLF